MKWAFVVHEMSPSATWNEPLLYMKWAPVVHEMSPCDTWNEPLWCMKRAFVVHEMMSLCGKYMKWTPVRGQYFHLCQKYLLFFQHQPQGLFQGWHTSSRSLTQRNVIPWKDLWLVERMLYSIWWGYLWIYIKYLSTYHNLLMLMIRGCVFR